MPKVKFSTLLSEVKGKSNGSVFSTNRSGSYFRTNKTGINKNSAKMGKAKNNLSSLSSGWRNLADEQQQAWRDAAPLYPKVDNMGNVVIPSGYQLFMRLNGTLTNQGRPVMPVPAAPREIPPIGTITENFPEYYQFNPNQVLNLNRIGFEGDPLSVKMTGLFNDFDIADYYAITMRYSFGREVIGMQLLQAPYRLFQFSNGSNSSGTLQISRLNQGVFLITLNFNYATYSMEMNWAIPATEIGTNTHIALVNNIGGVTGQSLFVNGQPYEGDLSQTGTYAYVATDYDFYIAKGGNVELAPYMVSDFRRIYDNISDNAILLISNGYEMPYPTTYVPMNEYSSNNVLASWGVQSGQVIEVLGNGSIPVTLTPYSFCLVPNFSLEFENYGASNLYVRIFASPPISNGRRGALSDFKQVLFSEWFTAKSWELGYQLKQTYGNVPGDSLVRWYVQIMDLVTGAVDYIKQEVKPKQPRFKAGTELGSKTN